jgi:hypothetical protein
MIVFYKRKERGRSKTYRFREELSIKTADNLIILLKLELKKNRNIPLKYKDR